MALTAKNNAIEGNKKMSEMLKAMQDINDASNNISRIIKVIDDIAFQTNNLHLMPPLRLQGRDSTGKDLPLLQKK